MDVEWEDLQAAFLSQRADRGYFLDRETGEVVTLSESEDDADDEGDDPGEDEKDSGDEKYDENEEALRLEMENDPDRFAEITPMTETDKVEWMNSFIVTMKQKDLVGQLTQAAAGERPERDFDRVLRKIPAERGRWLGYMETQVQEIIDGWIEENDIESETPPPWKPKIPRKRPKKAPEPE